MFIIVKANDKQICNDTAKIRKDADIIIFLQAKGSNMSNSIWLAIGLVLIVEGLGPLIAPNGWRNMVAQLSQQPDTQLRRIGGCLVVAGVVIAFMTYR
ncbi:hypothetical protein V12B01_10880 [Vibrio splendidus 12B01]|nr:hypothetical protein V12B01_10880 [Vibrio splendidus 12B01]PHX03699.1 hypothetical protein VSPL_48610 [Vibrio splendidus]CAK1930424.1 DUF2065 domain-containing protein [Vibrio crassostreae]CDU11098.1 conserved hypothetical protein [Vibrio coralliirubri]SBS65427.1 hypothetical protein VHE8714_02747 [Vibrio splendidus]